MGKEIRRGSQEDKKEKERKERERKPTETKTTADASHIEMIPKGGKHDQLTSPFA